LLDPVARTKIVEVLHEQGTVRNVEIQLHTKSQGPVDVLISVEQLEINSQACSLTVLYDVSNLKQAEREIQRLNTDLEQRNLTLEAANKELEVFNYSIAHDLRAPLTVLDGFSRLLLEDYHNQLDETGRDYLQHMSSASHRMEVLIDALLNLSRVNHIELIKEVVNLTQLVNEITSELQATQPKREVEFIIQEGLTANSNYALIRVALENLLGNAWKYTRNQSLARIEFGMISDGEASIYFIRDNGKGFSAHNLDKLFGPFQRLHSQDEFEGIGIGLATTQRIIHRHGGRVWAEGAVNQGATFYFTLS
jgi:light-regulated signal transduction histidine kinase (bacteriophytochrome)